VGEVRRSGARLPWSRHAILEDDCPLQRDTADKSSVDPAIAAHSSHRRCAALKQVYHHTHTHTHAHAHTHTHRKLNIHITLISPTRALSSNPLPYILSLHLTFFLHYGNFPSTLHTFSPPYISPSPLQISLHHGSLPSTMVVFHPPTAIFPPPYISPSTMVVFHPLYISSFHHGNLPSTLHISLHLTYLPTLTYLPLPRQSSLHLTYLEGSHLAGQDDGSTELVLTDGA